MLFNSAEYLLAFLPLVFFGYRSLIRLRHPEAAKAWLVIASLAFYAWWSASYLLLLVASMGTNFWLGTRLSDSARKAFSRGRMVLCGVALNLGVLGYYKYSDFAVANANRILDTHLAPPEIVLPLAVSFFTFTQIAYLVDCYRGTAREYSLLNYALFVTFFPHLIAGPILHHAEMMPQFESKRNATLRYSNVALGLFLISIGLFKKVMIADTLSVWASAGFDKAATLNVFEAWITSLSYTFQLYFDFSGYTDMAIGSALLFNIRLPINFNSPYKALDIQDFWRRWHITLSRFLRDYLYIPLGGNRGGRSRTLINLLITFTLGGLWHGASWMFVIWGALHGLAMVIHRLWRSVGGRLPAWLAWLVTFNFVNLAWVFFRAKEMGDATKVLKGMVGLTGVQFPYQLGQWLPGLARMHPSAFGPWIAGIGADFRTVALLAAMFVVVLAFRNSNQLAPYVGRPAILNIRWAVACAAMTTVSLVAVLASTYSEFIYFNF